MDPRLRKLTVALVVLSLAIVAVAITTRGRKGAGRDGSGLVAVDGTERRGGKVGGLIPAEDDPAEAAAAAGKDGGTGAKGADGKPAAPATSAADGSTTATAGMNPADAAAAALLARGLGPDGKPLPGATSKPGDENAAEAAAKGAKGDKGAGEEEEEAEDGDIIVAGRVLRGDSPVDGAEVAMSGAGYNNKKTTGGGGEYSFRLKQPGSYFLTLISPSSPNPRRILELQAADVRENEDFVIPKLADLTGIVLDTESNNPVPNAELRVLSGTSDLGGGTSGADGTFTLFPLNPGQYVLKGQADGYLPGEQAFSIADDAKAPPDVTLKLRATLGLTGTVTLADGSPGRGATVALVGPSAFNDPYTSMGTRSTGTTGTFAFPVPDSSIQQPFRAAAIIDRYLPGYSQPYTPAEAAGKTIEVVLPASATVKGRVVDDAGEGIEGATIIVREGFANTAALFQRFGYQLPSASTRLDGAFEFAPVEIGALKVTVAAEGFVSKDVDWNITGDIDIGEIALEGSDGAKEGRIFGVVTDERSTPMRQHNVAVQNTQSGEDFRTVTDANGGFRFDNLPEGDYILFTNGSTLRGDVFIPLDQTFPFAKPGDEQIYLVYDLSQSVRLRVVDASGQPVRNFRIGVQQRYNGVPGFNGTPESMGLSCTRTFQSAEGIATFDNLLRGTASFTISADNLGSVQKDGVEVPQGGQFDAGDVTLGSGATVAGVVTLDSGGPLGGVLVRALPPQGAPATHPLAALDFTTTTDGSGAFTMRGIPPGSADFEFTKSGIVRRRQSALSLSEGETNDLGTIILSVAARLTGRITNAANGQPASVMLTHNGFHFFSDGVGRYFVDTLPPGPASILVSDLNGRFKPKTVETNLIGGEEVTLDVQLEPN